MATRSPGLDAERLQRLRDPDRLAGELGERPLAPGAVLAAEDGGGSVGRPLRPDVQAGRRHVQLRSLEPGRPLDPARVVEHAVPRAREREVEIGGDGAPEAVGLVERDPVQRRIVLAAERARRAARCSRTRSCSGEGVQAYLTSGLATTNLVLANVRRRDLHGSRNLFRGTAEVVDARRRLVRPLHDHAGQHGGERGAAVDPGATSERTSPSCSGSSPATRSASRR